MFSFFYSIDVLVFMVMTIHKFNFKCFNFEFSAFHSYLKWGKRYRRTKINCETRKRRQYCIENFFSLKRTHFYLKV